MSNRICFFSIFILLYCSIVYAGEAGGPIEVNGDHVEYFPKEKKITGVGNVSIDYGNIKLTCDKITVYTETKNVYAEGNVLLKSPAGEVKGKSVKYNFETKKGEILEIRLKSGEWYAGGRKADIVSETSYVISDGYITSCDRENPHYKIISKSVTVTPDNKVVANNVLFKIGNVPIAYLPRYNYSLNGDWPTLDVIPGKKSKWGIFALTSYRYELDEENRLTLRIDERERWGLAEGLDYKYSLGDLGKGILRTYYARHRDRDRNEPMRAEEDRYRVQVRHRWDMTDKVTGILEYHKMGDNEMTKDFFYREEYDRESSPESYVYLLDRESEYSISFLARKRVNKFQGVVERLPEFRFDLKDQALFNMPVYFKIDTTIANLNSKTANNATDLDVLRFDMYNRLTAPLRLANFLSIAPFVGTRETFYSKDINGNDDKLRTAFYSGIDISTKFFKTYDASGRFLGVDFNKLHHIATPTIEYEYIHEPSITPGNFQQFDDIDSIGRKSTFTMGFENKLETKRTIDGKLTTYELGYLLLTGNYLYGPSEGSRFSNVRGDLEFTPYDWLRIESDTQYNPDTRDFQNWNVDFYVDQDDWRLGFGSRYWQGNEHELTSELFYKLNNEWSFRLFSRYDLKEIESNGHKIINRFDTKEITIIKDLHCWLGEVSLGTSRDGGVTAWFSLKLKASPKVAFDFKDYYAAPKTR